MSKFPNGRIMPSFLVLYYVILVTFGNPQLAMQSPGADNPVAALFISCGVVLKIAFLGMPRKRLECSLLGHTFFGWDTLFAKWVCPGTHFLKFLAQTLTSVNMIPTLVNLVWYQQTQVENDICYNHYLFCLCHRYQSSITDVYYIEQMPRLLPLLLLLQVTPSF